MPPNENETVWSEGEYWYAKDRLDEKNAFLGPFVSKDIAEWAYSLSLTHGKEVYVSGHGQILTQIHRENANCTTRGCCIHHPTDTRFPTLWRRDDRTIMEYVCPHGIGHPHPDHISWVRERFGNSQAQGESIHGCDGCCAPEDPSRGGKFI
jgi:hypothetical protein